MGALFFYLYPNLLKSSLKVHTIYGKREPLEDIISVKVFIRRRSLVQ
jgi:hypothetical protein